MPKGLFIMVDGETATASEKIGNVLRDARETSGASLDDISALLKIRSDHLQALENDDFERLPGSVYAIGFIRTYATHLRLNAGELIERYKAAVAVPHLEDQGPNPQTDVEPISGALKIAIGVMAVFVVYILWLIAGGAGDDKNTRITAAPSQSVEAVARPTNPKPKASAPSSVETASPSAASDAAKAQQDTQATAEISEIEPLDTQATPAAAAIAAAPVEDADIEIRASRRTWMRIESAQGQVLFSSIIRQGEGFKLESPDGYTLATRDAGALEFFVNDNAVGAVGRRGQILTARKIERAAIFAKSR
jgi:cytoskeleton protein RodZ